MERLLKAKSWGCRRPQAMGIGCRMQPACVSAVGTRSVKVWRKTLTHDSMDMILVYGVLALVLFKCVF